MIPAFDPQTNALPAGIHEATWAEVAERFGAAPRRQYLLDGMRWALQALAHAGCTRVYPGGSFVTAKAEPGDWDLAWEPAGVDPDRLDPVLLEFAAGRALQKARFYGESFPADAVADEAGTPYREFFRSDRQRRPVGVVALDPRTVTGGEHDH